MISPFTLHPSHFSEASLVQQTMAEYLEKELGWDSVCAYNNGNSWPDSLLGCKSDREVALTRFLTHYWLRLLAASELVSPERLVEMEKECDELIAILTSIVKKMRGKNK